MNRPYRIIPAFILFLSFSIPLKAQLDTLWAGHRAFADGRYSEAAVAYQAAIDQGSSWTWLPDLILAVEHRAQLGIIAPADTHRIGFIYITELRAQTDTGTTISEDVTMEQKEMWSIYFEVFRQTLESFSSGSWTVAYDTVSAISTYSTTSPLAPDNPDHLNLGPYFYETMKDVDTYITLSNTRSPSRGLARSYPYINHVLYGPSRGMAAINAGTSGYGGLLHEFFHAVEWVSDAIGMAHGYFDSLRVNFPGWTGTTEFDYYRWHFSETLPHVPWQRLNHRTRWIPAQQDENAIQSIRSVYQGISPADRDTADILVSSAKQLYGSDTSTAVNTFEQALTFSPYHPEALVLLHDHYRFASTNTIRRDELLARLRTMRAATDFATMDTFNIAYGSVAGFWHPEDTPRLWEQRTWDISPFAQSGDSLTVTFFYTKGWKALDIDSVELWVNGSEVGRDYHRGFSGNAKTDISYALALGTFAPGSTVEVRASIKGNGGTDSYGQIHVKSISATTSVNSSHHNPETFALNQNYPNPFNPATHIGFRIEDKGYVKVSVFDIMGREVASLVEQELPAGAHTTTWNASGMASGMYFSVLKQTLPGGSIRTAVRKMMLVR